MANLGLVYKDKGDKEKALYWLNEALKREDYYPSPLLYFGACIRKWIKELE